MQFKFLLIGSWMHRVCCVHRQGAGAYELPFADSHTALERLKVSTLQIWSSVSAHEPILVG